MELSAETHGIGFLKELRCNQVNFDLISTKSRLNNNLKHKKRPGLNCSGLFLLSQ